MSWASPGALVGLVLLPLLWWRHRRARRPEPVAYPSLLFLEEAGATPPPVHRLLDVDLLLALLAALLLVLGAAGPAWTTRPAGRTVVAVVGGGAPAAARGRSERDEAALAALRAALGPADRLVVVHEPPRADGPRPSSGALLAAALAPRAARRLVLTDTEPPPDLHGVGWVRTGDPASGNAGIVAVRVLPGAAGPTVFATVVGSAPGGAVLEVEDPGSGAPLGRAELRLVDGGDSAAVPLQGAPEDLLVRLVAGGMRDDLPLDDEVRLRRRAPRVRLAPDLPAAHRAVVARALDAALGPDGWTDEDRAPDLVVAPATGAAPAEGPWWLRLGVLPPGARGETAPPGPDRARADPLVGDLAATGLDLVYAPGARAAVAGAEVLLERDAPGGPWPIVARRGRVVDLVPDALAGRPPLESTPLWPLLVDDLLREVLGGEAAGGGWRAKGVLDLATTRLGRVRDPLPELDLAHAAPDRPAEATPLAVVLVALAAAALLALWVLRPALAARAARRRRPRRPVPSTT